MIGDFPLAQIRLEHFGNAVELSGTEFAGGVI